MRVAYFWLFQCERCGRPICVAIDYPDPIDEYLARFPNFDVLCHWCSHMQRVRARDAKRKGRCKWPELTEPSDEGSRSYLFATREKSDD